MKKYFFLFALFIMLPVLIHAQANFIPLTVDYGVYRGHQDSLLLEVYLSIPQNGLKFVKENNQYHSGFLATAEVFDGDSLIARDTRQRFSVVDSMSQIVAGRQYMNVFLFLLAPGEYQGKVSVRDIKSGNNGEYLYEIHPHAFSSDSLSISDVELSLHIAPDSTVNEFTKNTLNVIPNPSNLFGTGMPVVYYYAEVYNMKYDPANPGTYEVHSSITDKDGNVIKEFPEKNYTKPGKSTVLVGGNNLITLASSNYFLNLEVVDQETGQTVKKRKRFLFYKPDKNPQPSPEVQPGSHKTTVDISEYAAKTGKEMDQEFKEAGYIATSEEKKIFKTLNVDGKREFLANFWKRRDSTPGTEVNEVKRDYFQRIDYANQVFSGSWNEGWKTDRGRVILLYGMPDEVDRNYMEIDKKPYEVWHYYNLEGGVIFIFADLSGFGNYELLHSTYSRELSNPNWENMISKTRQGNSETDMWQN